MAFPYKSHCAMLLSKKRSIQSASLSWYVCKNECLTIKEKSS